MRLENNNLFRDLETRVKPAGMAPAQEATPTGSGTTSFLQSLGNAVREVDRAGMQKDEEMDSSVRGLGPELYKVLPAAEEAGLALQVTMQFRTKVLDAYQEVMRMQL